MESVRKIVWVPPTCSYTSGTLSFWEDIFEVVYQKMPVHVSFVHWARLRNVSATSPTATVFYVQTAAGEKVICAFAILDVKNHITYSFTRQNEAESFKEMRSVHF